MSTEPESASELDRTDQLPVLDVEAYEASLAETQKGLSRTDVWVVSVLQDMDELSETTRPTRRQVQRVSSRPNAAEITANVERILHRISELETEIATAHEANAVLQKRGKALENDRDEQVQRIRALEVEHARLSEHRALAESKVDTLERQLVEQSERANARLEELHGERRADADRHTQELAALDKTLAEEKAANTKLARQLAAKLKDCERMASEAEESQREHHALLLERESIIAQRDQQIAALQSELDSERERLAAAVAAAEEAEPRRIELESELEERDERIRTLTVELQTARDEQAIMAGQLGKLRNRVKSLTQQIFSRDSEIAALQEDLAVHSEALDAIRRDVNRIGGEDDEHSTPEVEHLLQPIDHDGEVILLDRRSYTIGRTGENDICVPSHLVSRHHARLLVGPTGVIVEDAGSTNGCFVNGEQVQQYLMHDGDVLEIGDVRYCLRTRSGNDTRVRTASLPSLVAVGPSSAALAPIST
jgi:chromosome segregation ATPase